MKSKFYLIIWKQVIKCKIVTCCEIVKGLDSKELLDKMKIFNASKRFTTTDYEIINLSDLFIEKHLYLKSDDK